MLKEAYRTIDMRERDRTVSLPMAQAIIRALNVGAAKGQFRAQRLATEMLTSIEREDKAACDAYVRMAMDYKFAWEKELERRKRHSIADAPEPLPHPDHIKLDLRAGTARIVGPSTKEEKVVYDHWIAQRLELLAEFDAVLRKKEDWPEAAKHSRSRTCNQRRIDLLRSTPFGRPLFRRCTALSAARSPLWRERGTRKSRLETKTENEASSALLARLW